VTERKSTTNIRRCFSGVSFRTFDRCRTRDILKTNASPLWPNGGDGNLGDTNRHADNSNNLYARAYVQARTNGYTATEVYFYVYFFVRFTYTQSAPGEIDVFETCAHALYENLERRARHRRRFASSRKM